MTGKLLTEFIGTFFLALTIGLAVLGATPAAALAIGSVLMVMVYMGGRISGAHYNPAVTLGVWMRGKMSAVEVVPYWVAQLLGAFAAAFVAWLVFQGAGGGALDVAPAAGTSGVAFFLLEFLFTFALVSVVLHTAFSDDTAGNGYYGLAIGFTLFVGAAVAGPLTGGAFNPAVALGPEIWGLFAGNGFHLGHMLTYVIAQLVAGALAALVFRMQTGASAEEAFDATVAEASEAFD